MRLGVFGGTFDPVHHGHLVLAEQCREQCRLDEIWFLPAGLPPHKMACTIAPGKARAEMLDLAVAGHSAFRVDRRELNRTTPSFTVDTLRELHAEQPDTELFFLMGGDSWHDFPTWREPGEILRLAQLAIVNRPAQRPATITPDLAALLGAGVEQRVHNVVIPALDLSSSDLRTRVREGRSIRFFTPRAVECYIEQQQLYREEPR